MNTVKVNFSKSAGKIKPMNCVNNGPAGSRVRKTGNFKDYEALKIPYARLHDSAFYAGNYGGEYSVDVHRLFPNFDADETNPENYVFEPTDGYLQDIESVGTKTFYRLGCNIEHDYKRGTYPPKDFKKWARICEYIIRHYTQGWGNGFTMDIEYWEIWNEPDCRNWDGSNPCWQGTEEQFFDLFEITAKHLKSCFPNLKIGGPAFTSSWAPMAERFLAEMQKRGVPMDFYSFHWYGNNPLNFKATIEKGAEQIKKYGYENAELYLNEWNYVRGWMGDDYNYSLKEQKKSKGASFMASLLAIGQKSELDMLMYYDARPTTWNGLFGNYGKLYKGYYVFKAFGEVADLKESVETETEEDIYAVASVNGDTGAVMISRFVEEDGETPDREVCVEINGACFGDKFKAQFYLLDENNDLTIQKEEFFSSARLNVYVKMPKQSVYLIKFVQA